MARVGDCPGTPLFPSGHCLQITSQVRAQENLKLGKSPLLPLTLKWAWLCFQKWPDHSHKEFLTFRVKTDPAQGEVLRRSSEAEHLPGTWRFWGEWGPPASQSFLRTAWTAGGLHLKGLVLALLCWSSYVLSFFLTLALFIFLIRPQRLVVQDGGLQCSRLNL